MSHNKGNAVLETLKGLMVAVLKCMAIIAAFAFNLLSALFSQIGRLLTKISGNGSGH